MRGDHVWTQDELDSFRSIVAETRPTGDLVRSIMIVPEHDCWDRCHWDKPTCKPNTGGWHGIGSRRITWGVALPGLVAVSLELHAPIYTDRALEKNPRLPWSWTPTGALDFHYANPPEYLRDWAKPADGCLLVGGTCWSDVTYLGADPGFEQYRLGGTPAVWAWLGEAILPDALVTAREASDARRPSDG